MAVTNETYLPTYDDVTVPELNISAPVFRAGAHHLGRYCDLQSKEYMLCHTEEGYDPRACLDEGKALTACGLEFFGRLKKHCRKQFTDYWRCIDQADRDMAFRECRTEQKPYDLCVLDQFEQERPFIGYFSMVRIHDSRRPQPQERTGPLPPPTKDVRKDWYQIPDSKFVKDSGGCFK